MPSIINGDCLAVMPTLPAESFDAIVCDPPYGLGFMGKAWDDLPPGLPWARECLRLLKPGGHILAFGGTRTSHRLAVAIEDAGFEIRDSIAWLYGSGFPKSLNVGKAIDKAAGAERTVRAGVKPGHENFVGRDGYKSVKGDGALSGEGGFARPWMEDAEKSEAYHHVMAPVTEAAKQWDGWGTALKPAFEIVVAARKPFPGTVAANVLAHGTGALNIDACRLATDDNRARPPRTPNALYGNGNGTNLTASQSDPAGRWPANVCLDESQAAALDEQSGTTVSRSGGLSTKALGIMNDDTWIARDVPRTGHNDSGGASRFFYCPKAGKRERPVVDGVAHPTVKPLALMQWLCRLVTPSGGLILDPFAGSGATLEAAILEGFRVTGIEREADYIPLIRLRLERAAP